MRAKTLTFIAALSLLVSFTDKSYSCSGTWCPHQSPVAHLEIISNSPAKTGESILMSSGGSYAPEGYIARCEYDFDGDGQYDYVVEGYNCQGEIHYTYYVPATYQPKVKLTNGLWTEANSVNTITITARTDIIYVNAKADTGGNGQSWSAAYQSLHDAIANADWANGKDEIWVAEGTYKPGTSGNPSATFDISHLKIYGGFKGDETYRNQRDWVRHKTILSGDIDSDGLLDADNSYHVVTCENFAVIDGFTITGGYADGSGSDANGAGIYNSAGSINIANCCIVQNIADSDGGGMYSRSGADANIANCVFSGNVAWYYGGGIATSSAGQHTIVNCTIADNAADANGGGISNQSSSNIQVINSILWGNTAQSGNEIYSEGSHPTISYCDIEGGLYGSGCSGWAAMDGDGNRDNDPLFVDADNPAGPDGFFGTFDDGLVLRSDSPCIDKGSAFLASYNSSVAAHLDTSTDILKNQRLINRNRYAHLRPDMGAYESPNVWYVNAGAADGHLGRYWTEAIKYLQDAIGVAKSGEQIWVAAGTYKPDEGAGRTAGSRTETFQLKEGVTIYGGFEGNETLLEDRDLVLNKTILSGDIDENDANDGMPKGSNSYHVVTGTTGAILDGFVIEKGDANSTSSLGGGGMLNDSNSPIVRNCHFLCNHAAGDRHGGGMYNHNSDSTLINCVFSGNAVLTSNGGTVTYGFGGGIYNDNSSRLNLINCTLGNNLSNKGGGIYNDNDSSGSLKLANCILWDNRVSGTGSGSAQIRVNSGTAIVNYSCIQGGWSGGSGNIGSNLVNHYPKFVNPGHWDSTAAPDSIVLQATVRDFLGKTTQEVNIPSGFSVHPDFENTISGIDPNIVEEQLDEYYKPVYKGGTKGSTTDEPNFKQWFNDTPGRNLSTTINLELQHQQDGSYKFDNNAFFPIDDCLFGKFNTYSHNYHFTLELHTTFTYNDSEAARFFNIFGADDDLFIFINKQLVVDLGGIHSVAKSYVEIDDYGDAKIYADSNMTGDPCTVDLNLVSGQTYSFDLFFAERHTTASNLRFSTNIALAQVFSSGDYRLQAGSAGIDAGDNSAAVPDAGRDIGSYTRFYNDPNTAGTGVDMGAWEYRANAAPIVVTGTYNTITLPTSEIVLDKSSVKDDRMPYPPHDLTFTWSKISGPNDVIFGNANALHTTVRGLTQVGTYELQLSASDGELSSPGITTITVQEESDNEAPVVNAGAEKSCVLLANKDWVVLNDATVSDDGKPNPPGAVTTRWTKQSGPGTVRFDDANAVVTSAHFSWEGTYVLRLTADDGEFQPYNEVEVTVHPSPWIDVEIVEWLSRTQVQLKGTIYYDATGLITSTKWSVTPADTVTFSDVDSLETVAAMDGTHSMYILRLTGYDISNNEVVSGIITVTVQPTVNIAPVVNAGIPRTIILPQDSLTIQTNPTVTDDGLPNPPGRLTYQWDIIDYPGGVSSSQIIFVPSKFVENPEITFPAVTNPNYPYQLRLTASDGPLSDSGILIVTIKRNNECPQVDAGEYTAIKPSSENGTVSLYLSNAVATDLDGLPSPLTYRWDVVAGPQGATIDFNDTSSSYSQVLHPTVTFNREGTYVLRLEAYDGNCTNGDTTQITVEPPSEYTLAVFAGDDKEITRPALVVLDDAFVEATGGTSAGPITKWSSVSGPGFVSFADANMVNTSARFSRLGEYVLRLEATDGLATEFDEVTVKVKPGVILGGGETHTLIALEDGTVRACGLNNYGQLGNGGRSEQKIPMAVLCGEQVLDPSSPLLSNIQAIDAGWVHSIALDADGNVWTWGSNSTLRCKECSEYTWGQLGNGSENVSPAPVKVHKGSQNSSTDFLKRIVAVSAGRCGSHSLAVESNGLVWAWGRGDYGQLGAGTINSDHSLLPLGMLKGGQDYSTSNYLENIIDVSAGVNHSMALERLSANINSKGRVYTCGKGYLLGAGINHSDACEPVLVLAGEQSSTETYLQDIVAISAGWFHCMALEKLDQANGFYGRVYTWGYNYYDYDYYYNYTGEGGHGRLGNGSGDDHFVPVKVHAGAQGAQTGDPNLRNIIAISAGHNYSAALDVDGRVWTWGDNTYGQLGTGNTDSSHVPVQVVASDEDEDGDGNPDRNGYLGDDVHIIAISAGYYHCLALDANGVVWAWGQNKCGQLGIGPDSASKTCPQRVFLNAVYNSTHPKWYRHINDALLDADNGDELIAYPGTYYEWIDFVPGTNLTLRSADPMNWDIVRSTVLKNLVSNDVVKFEWNSVATLAGFTITGVGSGIECDGGSSPTIINNIITDNYYDGIFCAGELSPIIRNNIISKNAKDVQGYRAGICLYNVSGASEISGNTIVDNKNVDNNGYGIYRWSGSEPNIHHNIIWGNGTNLSDSFSNIKYCCIENGLTGNGNISTDPCFISTGTGDYHLKAKSLCINHGGPWLPLVGGKDIDGQLRRMGSSVDMGADEFSILRVDAGKDRQITLIESQVELDDANVTDNGVPGAPGQNEWKYQWSIIEGPGGGAAFTDTQGNTSPMFRPTVSFTAPGEYVLELMVYEDKDANEVYDAMSDDALGADIVVITVSLKVEAGPDQYLAMPDCNAVLSGQAPGFAWTQWVFFGDVNGDVDVSIANPDALETTVTFPSDIIANYILYLLAYDANDELAGYDFVCIHVGNQGVSVEAGNPREIVWPVDYVVLSDAYVYPETFNTVWLGGEGVVFDNNGVVNTTVYFPGPNIYKLVLYALLGDGYVAYDTVSVTVKFAATDPCVYAGSNKISRIGSDGRSVRELNDAVIIYEGELNPSCITPMWSQVSGPNDVIFSNSSVINPTATFTQAGIYVLKLREEYTTPPLESTVTVRVYDAEQGVTLEAGSKKTVEMPADGNGPAEVCLSDAWVQVQVVGYVDVNWTAEANEGDGPVTWIVDGNDGPGSIVNPIVQFWSPGKYTLTLTAVPHDPWPAVSDFTHVYVTQNGQTADNNAPKIDDFSLTWNTDPFSSKVDYDEIVVEINATDVGWGIDKIELRWNDANGALVDEIYGRPVYPNQLELEHIINTSSILNDVNYTLYAKVTDRRGNSGWRQLFFSITDMPLPDSNTPPVADITNEVFYQDGVVKTNPLPVLQAGLFRLNGSAYYPEVNQYVIYSVDLFKSPITALPSENWNDKTYGLAEECNVINLIDWCEGSIVNGDLGELDLSDIGEGSYQLLLTVIACDMNGKLHTAYSHVGFVLDSRARVGNIKFTQEDLVIPAGALALKVVRSYDSFNRGRDSDFGYGWNYSIANMDVKLNEERSDNVYLEDIYGWSVDRSIRVGPNGDRNVTLTLPDGQKATFLFCLQRVDRFTYKAAYISPPGVNATLSTKDEEILMVLPSTREYCWKTQGFGFLGSVSNAANYDFSGFVLTTEDGTKYHIDREQYDDGGWYWADDYQIVFAKICGEPYLSSITMPTGEEINFGVNAANRQIGNIEFKDNTGDTIKTVQVKYACNRISAIWAPNDDKDSEPATIKYEYDGKGNLTKVHKLVDKAAARYETTTYVYEDANHVPEEHFITSIKDARGLSPIVYEYDDSGILIGVIDARGHEIAITHDSTGRTEAVEDRNGNLTIYGYNERGNVTWVENALGQTTIYEYGDPNIGSPGDAGYRPGNPDKPTTVKVPLTVNPVSDVNYSITQTTYDDKGRVVTVTDSEGNLTENFYEDGLNLTKVVYSRPNGGNYVEVSTTRNTYTVNNLLKATEVTTGPDSSFVTQQMTVNIYDEYNRLKNVVGVDLSQVNPSAMRNLDNVSGLDATKHSITTYHYDLSQSNSADQPDYVTDAAGFTRYFKYDKNGNQTHSSYNWVDPSGQLPSCVVDVNTVYDSQGRVLQTSRQIGNAEPVILSKTTYNGIGKVDTSINEFGALTKYEYDESGNLVETRTYTDSTQTTTLTESRTLYDAEGRVLVAVDAHEPGQAANGTENLYDELGRVKETRRWANVDVNLVDLKANNVKVGLQVPDNVEPNNAWNGSGTQPSNIGWTVGNNALPKINDGNELSYTRTEYDVGGRVWKTYTLDESGVEHVTTYGYDKAGRQTIVTDALNHSTTTHYSGTMRDYVTDARNNTTSFTYDALGRVIKTTYPATEFAGSSGAQPTYVHVHYDSLGRKDWESEQTTEDSGQITEATNIKQFEYDSAGRLIKVTLPQVANPDNGGAMTHPIYRYVYDTYGNNIAQIDAKNRITIFKFNELNQQTHKYQPFVVNPASITDADSVYDELNSASPPPLYEESTYYANGQLKEVIDFEGQKTKYEYDGQGRLEYNKYYGVGHSSPDKTVQYVYDNLGRKAQVIENDGTTRTTTYHYNADGNIVQMDTPEGTVYYDCNDITNRKEAVRTANTKMRYSYDTLGRLYTVSAVKRDGQNLSSPEVTTYNYDVVGNRGGAELANGVTATHVYDNCNRLTSITHSGSLSSFTYGLYADGMRHAVSETLKYPGDVTETHNITYTYDNLNRLTDEAATSSSDGYSQSYTYDLAGNRLTRTVAANGQTLTTEYQYYTGTDKLHKEIHTGPVACVPLGNERYYAYANNGVGINYRTPTGLSVGGFSAFMLGLPTHWEQHLLIALLIALPIMFFTPLLLSFLWKQESRNRNGFRIKYGMTGLALWRRGMCVLLAYIMLLTPGLESIAQGATQYNQLSTTHWASGNTTIEYQYDGNGSCTQKVTKVTSTNAVLETLTYDYNLRNKLAKVTKDTYDGSDTYHEITEYTYNDEGIRVKSDCYWTVNTDTTKNDEETKIFLIDSYNHTGYAQVLEESNGANRTTYTIGDDVITQSNYDGSTASTYQLIYDGHGSTRQLVMNNGAVADTFSYDGYGVMLGGNPDPYYPPQTKLLYAGEYFDTALQQYNLRARYYDTLNGRFNQADSFTGDNEEPQSLHKYLYANCNPISNMDPSGQFSMSEVISVQSISRIIGNLNLGAVYKAYSFVDTTVAAINLFNQWQSTGRIDYFALGLLAASIVPLGQLLGKVKISANRVINASEDLTNFLQQAGSRTNRIVQAIGEMGAELAARAKGFIPTNFTPSYHGFDNIYRSGKRFVIVESKGGTGRIATGQMSQKWIYDNIRKLARSDDAVNRALAKELEQAWAENAVDAMVVTTEIIGDKVQDPRFIFKTFQEIGKTAF